MKLRAEVGEASYLVEVTTQADGTPVDGIEELTYSIEAESGGPGPQSARSGTVSMCEVMPGVISVVEGHRSSVVRLSPRDGGGWIASIRGKNLPITLADPRDRAPRAKAADMIGPQEVRAMMPGKVIRVLVQNGDQVTAGQGVMIVEAMKMQNELKSPKAGRVTRVFGNEGATVTAGATLLVIE